MLLALRLLRLRLVTVRRVITSLLLLMGFLALWLKDVVSSTYFADAIGDGYAYYGNASVSVGLLFI